MDIKRKLVLITGISIVIFASILYVIISNILLSSFDHLERIDAQEDARRAQRAFVTRQSDVAFVLSDYAEWTETYNYLSGTNPAYEEAELIDDVLVGIGMDAVAFTTPAQGITFIKMVDLEEESEVPVDPALRQYLSQESYRFATQGRVEYVDIGGALWLIGVHPVLTSEKKGHSPGNMIMARRFTEEMLGELIGETNLPMSLVPHEFSTIMLDTVNESVLLTMIPLPGNARDIRIEHARPFHQLGKFSTRSLLLTFVFSTLLAGGMTIAALHYLVVRRLSILDNQVRHLDTARETKVTLEGNDELSRLADAIDQSHSLSQKNIRELKKTRGQLLKTLEELKHSNSKLKQLDRAKSEFLNMVSHELKTPLTPISTNAELLYDGDIGRINKRQKERLVIIKRNTARLQALINNLLEIARIETGKLKLSWDRVNPSQVAREVFEDIEVAAQEKGLSVKLVDGKAGFIEADRDRIKECLSNFANNALKFTQSGSITISVRPAADAVTFSVTDTGFGIEQKFVKNLFQKFYQVSETEVGKSKGVGLGLYSTKRIVHLHNGVVGVKTALGRGSEFWFTIPRRRK